MLIKSGKGLAVYYLEGIPGALVDPKTWERLLAGEMILIMEPDALKFTLFADEQPLHQFMITGFEDESVRDENARLSDALKTVMMSEKRLSNRKLWTQHGPEMWATVAIWDAHLKKTLPISFILRPGEPKYLNCPPEKIANHRAAGRETAEDIAKFYAEIVKTSVNMITLSQEIERHNLRKEGYD